MNTFTISWIGNVTAAVLLKEAGDKVDSSFSAWYHLKAVGERTLGFEEDNFLIGLRRALNINEVLTASCLTTETSVNGENILRVAIGLAEDHLKLTGEIRHANRRLRGGMKLRELLRISTMHKQVREDFERCIQQLDFVNINGGLAQRPYPQL